MQWCPPADTEDLQSACSNDLQHYQPSAADHQAPMLAAKLSCSERYGRSLVLGTGTWSLSPRKLQLTVFDNKT